MSTSAARRRAQGRARRAASRMSEEEENAAGPSGPTIVPGNEETPEDDAAESTRSQQGALTPTTDSIIEPSLGDVPLPNAHLPLLPLISTPAHTSVEERHAQLRRMIAAKRQQEEIESMEAELRGEVPNNPVEVEGTTLPIRKRPASLVTDNPAKYIKLGTPPFFYGKSLGELQ